MSHFMRYSKYVPCYLEKIFLDDDLSIITDTLDKLHVRYEIRTRECRLKRKKIIKRAVYVDAEQLTAAGLPIRLPNESNGTYQQRQNKLFTVCP